MRADDAVLSLLHSVHTCYSFRRRGSALCDTAFTVILSLKKAAPSAPRNEQLLTLNFDRRKTRTCFRERPYFARRITWPPSYHPAKLPLVEPVGEPPRSKHVSNSDQRQTHPRK